MSRQFARWVNRRLVSDPQARLLLRGGADGLRDGGFGLLTALGHWMAPFARRWAKVWGGNPLDIAQPTGCPGVDLGVDDPIAAITASPGFRGFSEFFNVASVDEPRLVSADTQALLYALVRNLRPRHVVEIGTYRLSTSRVICRALHANGGGILHTVDPIAVAEILKRIRRWPPPLRDHLRYYPFSSMEFFKLAVSRSVTADLVFVDGNHDYEYALFDILSAARLVTPGGFIAIDNISQGGPFYAARDFMRERSGWLECGHALEAPSLDKAFDLERSTIPGTDLCVLRAPARYFVGPRLETSGAQWVDQGRIGGIELAIANRASGTLHAQYVVRVVKPQPRETTTETAIELHDAMGLTRVELPWQFDPEEMPLLRSIELWLGWSGDKELELSERPVFY